MKFNVGIVFIVYHWFSIISISISNELTINNVEQKYIGLPQMATFRNYEEMNEYISRKRDIIHNPLMDSYLSAYNLHHESFSSDVNHRITKRMADPYDYIKFEVTDAIEPDKAVKDIVRKHRQKEEEEIESLEENKKPKRIVRTKKRKINHKIVKRSADPINVVQFELSDAKEPDEAVKAILRLRHEREQKDIELLEGEKKLITIYGTKKTEINHKIKKRSADPLDFIKFELSDAKEPDEAVREILKQHREREQKSMRETKQDLQPLLAVLNAGNETSGMEMIGSDNDQDIDESRLINFYHPLIQIPVKSKASIEKFPLPVQKAINLVLSENKNVYRVAPALPPVQQKYFGDKLVDENYKLYETKLLNNVGHVANNLKFIYPNYHQLGNHYNQPHAEISGVTNDYNQVHNYAHNGGNAGHINSIHGNPQVVIGKPLVLPQLAPQVIKYVYHQAPEVIPNKEPASAAEQAIKNYKYISTSNVLHNELLAKPSLANNGFEFNGAGGIAKDLLNNENEKNSYSANLGNYLQSSSVKDAVLQKNLPESNIDAISKYNALTEKSTTNQFHGITYLLQNDIKEQPYVSTERPQDNRAPILFHPELKGKIQQPRNYYINQYGFQQVHPVATVKGSLNDFKPITEPTEDIHKEQIVHVTPYPIPYKNIKSVASTFKFPAAVSLEGEGFGLKSNYKELLDAKEHQYASKYAFGYRVRDFHTGNDFGHEQNRDNDGVTRGQYHILLPDGRVQNVRYHADDSGFHADVSFETGHEH